MLLSICIFNTLAILVVLRNAQSKHPTDAETIESEAPELYGSREVQALNRSFDERIAQMEAELSTTTLYDESTPAPSYDPRVVALPHDSVRIAPKVEHEYAQ